MLVRTWLFLADCESTLSAGPTVRPVDVALLSGVTSVEMSLVSYNNEKKEVRDACA